jgi:hypothetical protein
MKTIVRPDRFGSLSDKEAQIGILTHATTHWQIRQIYTNIRPPENVNPPVQFSHLSDHDLVGKPLAMMPFQRPHAINQSLSGPGKTTSLFN